MLHGAFCLCTVMISCWHIIDGRLLFELRLGDIQRPCGSEPLPLLLRTIFERPLALYQGSSRVIRVTDQCCARFLISRASTSTRFSAFHLPGGLRTFLRRPCIDGGILCFFPPSSHAKPTDIYGFLT
ncbi:hypothetical protein C8Q79DRAFT_215995 [Trametes meyenii]|nr:hypothetical protein C8Q79DRAFT_215995 [Trametes meyenii]